MGDMARVRVGLGRVPLGEAVTFAVWARRAGRIESVIAFLVAWRILTQSGRPE
ncbi:hypothetical protein GCM10020001_086900 [Nonomuraea salmonea]